MKKEILSSRMVLNNLSRYRSSSAHNQLLIDHIMSKTIFMKYLPPVRPKLVLKLKRLRIY